MKIGQLSGDRLSIVTDGGAPIPRTTAWGLDNLGNWSGGGDNPGTIRTGDFDGDGTPDMPRLLHHEVNDANEITTINEHLDGQEPGSTTIHYDPAGNLVCDGTYYYQYDP